MPLIRTTIEPWREIDVSDGVYLTLLRQGLVFTDGPPPPPPVAFTDAQYDELDSPNSEAARRLAASLSTPGGALSTELNATFATSAQGAKADAAAPAATVIPKWASGVSYAVNARVVSPAGDSVYCIEAHTSGSTFDMSKWDTSGTYLPMNVSGIATGLTATIVGNSYMASGANGLYGTRVAIALGIPDSGGNILNLATAGNRMQDSARDLAATGGSKSYPAGRGGIVIVGDLLNNLMEADTPANRSAALEGLRAAVVICSASQRIEQTDAAFTYYGAWWTTNAQAYASGGTVASVTTDASYVEVTMPSAGRFYMLMHGTNGVSLRGGVATFTLGGTTLATVDLDAKMVNGQTTTNGVAPVVVDLGNRASGDVVRITHSVAGRSGTLVTLIDALLKMSTTPPVILVQKPLPVIAATHTGKNSLLAYLRTVPDLVKAEFPGIVTVFDPIAGWDVTRMLQADGLHPNALGWRLLRDGALRALDRTLYRLPTQLMLA